MVAKSIPFGKSYPNHQAICSAILIAGLFCWASLGCSTLFAAAPQSSDNGRYFHSSTTSDWSSRVPKLLSDSDNNGDKNGDVGQDEGDGWRPASLGVPAGSSSTAGDERVDSIVAAESNPSLVSEAPANAAADPWVQTILAEGQQLAGNDRWSEALAVYQAALRKAPNNQVLLNQRQTARLHVDLRGRMSDTKYLTYAQTDSVEMAQAHLNEILYNIELNYIESPNWAAIFQHGLRSLELTQDYPDYQEKMIGQVSRDTFARAVQQIRESLQPHTIRSHSDYSNSVRQVAFEMHRQLQVRPSVVLHEFASTAVSALDIYSAYLSPGMFDDWNSQIRGNFVGIGVELRSKPEHLEIMRAIPGGPADRARIRKGDKVLAVNDQPVTDIGGDAAADLLKGSEGSAVTVVVETPEGKQYRLKMQRARVEIPSIDDARIVDQEQGIGYIKLSNFQKNTVQDFDLAFQGLQRQGLKSLILDLRDNPGGVLEAAVGVADRFLHQGTIVSTKGRSLRENLTYPAHSRSDAGQMPIIVLINENSASASEILAAAIADQNRGTLMGQRSFGKGMVQTILPLTSGRGGMKLTTAEYFSPTGRRVELQGVSPDFTVQSTARPIISADDLEQDSSVEPMESDPVLAAALRRAAAR